MDSLIAAAARALAAGDPLSALKRVSLRDDPSALALRGIAMAQLRRTGARARTPAARGARLRPSHEALSRARCVVAEAEVALAMRDLAAASMSSSASRTLAEAVAALEARHDHANALHARLIAVRRLLLLGRLDEAARALAELEAASGRMPPALLAVAELATAEIALRRLHTSAAAEALARAQAAAERARVPALLAEVAEARNALVRPAARRFSRRGDGE